MEKIRLQKILADSGVASRRAAEALIAEGKVKVNGRRASIGDHANPRTDRITVEGRRLEPPPSLRYLLLNKPRGTVSTMKDEQGRKCVASLVADAGARVFPVGRLDRESEGLLLMTNDGAFANAIAHPSHHIAKVYRVTIRPGLSDEQAMRFREGIVLPAEKTGERPHKTAPAELVELSRSILADEEGRPAGERIVAEVTLREGRNRQIRRMFEQLGLEVARLRRVAVGGVRLGMLPPGKWRELTEAEVLSLKKMAGLDSRAPRSGRSASRPGSPGSGPTSSGRTASSGRTTAGGGKGGRRRADHTSR